MIQEFLHSLGRGGHGRAGEKGEGGGGGVLVFAQPCGAIEVTPDATRFIAFGVARKLGAALALGFLLGAAATVLTRTRRIEIMRRPD